MGEWEVEGRVAGAGSKEQEGWVRLGLAHLIFDMLSRGNTPFAPGGSCLLFFTFNSVCTLLTLFSHSESLDDPRDSQIFSDEQPVVMYRALETSFFSTWFTRKRAALLHHTCSELPSYLKRVYRFFRPPGVRLLFGVLLFSVSLPFAVSLAPGPLKKSAML